MKFTYFPGCSLKGLGKAYDESFLAVCRRLNIELQELEDWNCCGATAYMAVDEHHAVILAARNLALAEKQGPEDIIAPCAGCYLVLNKAEKYLEKYPRLAERVKGALAKEGYTYTGQRKVLHPLDVLVSKVGVEKIKQKITNSLKGLKVACYYGCQIIRPYAVFDDQHDPQTMDNLIACTGAEPIDFPLKTKCCGGSLTGTLSEVGLNLCHALLREMKKRGADVIVTACPLCQFNLDAFQTEICKEHGEDVSLPVLYFSQLLGLALGASPKEVGLQRQIVSPNQVLKSKNLIGQAQAAAQ